MPSKAQSTQSKAKRTRKPSGPLDAIQLLKADHQEVSDLFEEYQQLVDDEAGADEKEALASQICKLLTMHTTIEEEIFYPALREAMDDQDMLDEAVVEHASAKELIEQIQAMSPSDELYDAKVTVLGEYIEHHVEEEEKEMFPKAKKTEADMDELGIEMSARRQELLDELDVSE